MRVGLALVAVGAALVAIGLSCSRTADVDAAARRCHYRLGGRLPDPACTPGMTWRVVRQYTDWHDDPYKPRIDTTKQTICKPGWAATVRPPSSYTRRLKLEQMRAYGAAGPPSAYQEDHLVPLELGGDPRSPANLWPQPAGFARRKDKVETRLHRLVCAGKISLWAARGLISASWVYAEAHGW